MHLALTDLFRAKWTVTIHEEWIRNVLRNRPDLPREQLERTRHLMDSNIRDCLVEGYEGLVDSLVLPDPADRHVLAAAIVCQANLIITFNRKDFPATALSPHGIEAQHPDRFVIKLIDLEVGDVCAAMKRHRQSLRFPAKNVVEYLTLLARQGLVETVSRLHGYTHLL